MTDENSKELETQANNDSGEKKPFTEPDMREFDDLEKQIKSPLIGIFTP